MSNQPPTRAGITVLFIALLVGSAIAVLIGTFVPPYVSPDEQMILIMRILLYAVAVLNIVEAFRLKAKLTKQLPPEERKTGGTIQRQ